MTLLHLDLHREKAHMYTVNVNQSLTDKSTNATPAQQPALYTGEQGLKLCLHCKRAYRSICKFTPHCYKCAICGTYKPLTLLAGRAKDVGYVCKSCYQREGIKNLVYILLLRL